MNNSDVALTTPKSSRVRSRGDEPGLARLLSHLPWILLVAIAAIFGVLMLVSADFRATANTTWDVLTSGDQTRIREYIQGYGAWGPLASVLLMTLQVVVAPIPASVVQLSNGVVYGLFWGTVLNVIGQMFGAIAAFYIARSLGHGAAERLAGRIDEQGLFERWLEQWGAKALFVIRAIPGMPSDFVSYLTGLTNMPARRYIVVSLLGYIPQSIAYAWLGDFAMDWFIWIIVAGFGISAIIGVVVWWMQKRQKSRERSSDGRQHVHDN